MADRFNRVYQLASNLYTDGSPVIIENGVLLYDTISGQLLIQLKFHSIFEKIITELHIDIGIQDAMSNQINSQVHYCYQNLYDSKGSRFGSNKAIIVTKHNANAFTVQHMKVVFDDQSIWENEADFTPLSASQPIFFALENEEVRKQYCLAIGAQANVTPIREVGLWQCTCGEWNYGEVCTKCRLSAETVFGAFDLEQLTKDAEARVAEEQKRLEQERIAEEERLERERVESAEQQRLEAERIAEQVKTQPIQTEQEQLTVEPQVNPVPKRSNSNKKRIAMIAIVAVALICVVLVVFNFDYLKAESLYKSGRLNAASAAVALAQVNDSDAMKRRSLEVWDEFHGKNTVALGSQHLVCILDDWTVAAYGENDYGRCDVDEWTDIVSVAADIYHTVGLKYDGTVVACGSNLDGQCYVENWTDIIAISVGPYHTVGLKSDGTVVATGSNSVGQCDVEDWTDIIAISCGLFYTVGLKSDGTVVATGSNFDGQCDVEDWTDIVAISGGRDHTVGLKSDGIVVATGSNSEGQCDVEDWTDIIAISASPHWHYTIGVRFDGQLVWTGSSDIPSDINNSWKNVTSVETGALGMIGFSDEYIYTLFSLPQDADWYDLNKTELDNSLERLKCP